MATKKQMVEALEAHVLFWATKLEQMIATITLNKASDAYNDLDRFAALVLRAEDSVREFSIDASYEISASEKEIEEFADMISDAGGALEELRGQIEHYRRELEEMFNEQEDEDEDEDMVQDFMENEVIPDLESSVEYFATSV